LFLLLPQISSRLFSEEILKSLRPPTSGTGFGSTIHGGLGKTMDMFQNMTKMKWLYVFPVVLTSIGIGIHLLGGLKLFQLDVPWFAHAIMLLVDALVVIGLLQQSRWGYWLGVLLYIQQSIMQPYWGFQAYLQGGNIYLLVAVSSLCVASLITLLFNRGLFDEPHKVPKLSK
jgi:hypothetical protein